MAKRTTIDALAELIEVEPNSGCWIWTGVVLNNGYGQVGYGGRKQSVHRLIYELATGPIPEGLVLDHLCRNRACCNPRHLEAVRNQVNVWRGIALANNERCKSGRHEVTPQSVMVDSEGVTRCRECRSESKRRYAQRRAA